MTGAARVFCDWGGSQLRAYLEACGAILEERTGPGIGQLAGTPASEALRTTLEPWTARDGVTAITLCGMAGSRNGLVEVPYCPTPADREAWVRGCLQHRAGGLQLTVAPGVQGVNPGGRPDVMRGEETQVFGAMALRPELAAGRQLIVLPGTHSKWVEADAGRIGRFQTCITGELFALLSGHSSLTRVSSDESRFEEGLTEGMARGASHALETSLFETRAAQLLQDRTRGWARGFLSGLLIGAEVRTMLQSDLILHRLTLVGDPPLTALYARALAPHGINALQLEGRACVIAGLRLLPQAAAGP